MGIVRLPDTLEGVCFTTGDLVEGLEFLEPVERRAVVFGLSMKLSCDQVVELTHAQVTRMHLTPLAAAAIEHTARHLRLNYVFWSELRDGMVSPLFNLALHVQAAFGGMSWEDLATAYARMVWVDHQCDTEDFVRHMREQGLIA